MLSEWTLIVAAYLYTSCVGAFFIAWLYNTLIENNYLVDVIKGNPTNYYIPNNGWVRNFWQTATVGIIERVLYLTSIVVGKPEFIAIWLTLKTVYVSWNKEESSSRRTFNTFLIGNGLEILYAFAGASIIQGATGSIWPSRNLPTILQKSNSLLWFSILMPIILSLALKAFLSYAHKELNDQEKKKHETQTNTPQH